MWQRGMGGAGVSRSPMPEATQVPPVRQNGTSAPTRSASSASSRRPSGRPQRRLRQCSTPAALALPPARPAATAVVPLIVCCLIVMVLMSFVNLTKYRDRFQLIAGLLGIAFAIGIQFVAAGFAEVESEQAILEMMGKANEMVGMFGKIFFTIPPRSSFWG